MNDGMFPKYDYLTRSRNYEWVLLAVQFRSRAEI